MRRNFCTDAAADQPPNVRPLDHPDVIAHVIAHTVADTFSHAFSHVIAHTVSNDVTDAAPLQRRDTRDAWMPAEHLLRRCEPQRRIVSLRRRAGVCLHWDCVQRSIYSAVSGQGGGL